MATPTNLSGIRWRLLVGDMNNPELFSYLCTIVTQDLDRKLEMDDSMVVDCDTPDAIPTRQSTPKAITWDVTFSGKVDALRYASIETIFESAAPRDFQFIKDLPGAAGGATQQGSAYIDSLKQTKTENGVVSFSGSLKGQGVLARAALP